MEEELILMREQLMAALVKVAELEKEARRRKTWSELEQEALIRQSRERLKYVPGEYTGPKRGKRQTLRLWALRFRARRKSLE